jgi:hypothetical protein
MLTTPGVTRASIGAKVGTAPPTSGIGAAAMAECAAGMIEAAPLIRTSADKTLLIVVRTLRQVRIGKNEAPPKQFHGLNI